MMSNLFKLTTAGEETLEAVSKEIKARFPNLNGRSLKPGVSERIYLSGKMCTFTCSGSCAGTCRGSCEGSCAGTCSGNR